MYWFHIHTRNTVISGVDPGMGQSGPAPPPLLTAKSCKFSLFWDFISQILTLGPLFLQSLNPALVIFPQISLITKRFGLASTRCTYGMNTFFLFQQNKCCFSGIWVVYSLQATINNQYTRMLHLLYQDLFFLICQEKCFFLQI